MSNCGSDSICVYENVREFKEGNMTSYDNPPPLVRAINWQKPEGICIASAKTVTNYRVRAISQLAFL
jgi:hypothetical protein